MTLEILRGEPACRFSSNSIEVFPGSRCRLEIHDQRGRHRIHGADSPPFSSSSICSVSEVCCCTTPIRVVTHAALIHSEFTRLPPVCSRFTKHTHFSDETLTWHTKPNPAPRCGVCRFRGDLLPTFTGSQLVCQLVFQLVVAIRFGRQRRLAFLLIQAVQAAFRLPGWMETADELMVPWRCIVG